MIEEVTPGLDVYVTHGEMRPAVLAGVECVAPEFVEVAAVSRRAAEPLGVVVRARGGHAVVEAADHLPDDVLVEGHAEEYLRRPLLPDRLAFRLRPDTLKDG